MENYYIYNGHLYSQEELTHFKLGFIKPGHKWITRERKNGKYVYTYRSRTADDNKNTAVDDTVNAAKYDAETITLQKELDGLLATAGRNGKAPDQSTQARIDSLRLQIKLNKSLSQRAYSNAESAKRQSVSAQRQVTQDDRYQRNVKKQKVKQTISKGIESIKSGELAAKLSHPLNKEARDEAASAKAKAYLDKKLATNKARVEKMRNSEVWQDYRKALKTDKTYLKKEYKVANVMNRERDVAANRIALNKLASSSNKVNGLNVQTDPHTAIENQKAVNPGYQKANSGSEYTTNCSNCSVAYDMRQRGYDVEAKGRSETAENYSGTDEISEIYKMYDGNKSMAYVYSSELLSDEQRKQGYSQAKPSSEACSAISSAATTGSNSYNTWPKDTAYQCAKAAGVNNAPNATIDNKKYIQELEKEMLKGGNGSRGIIEVQWAGYNSGHSMAYEVRNNQVIVIDAQTNQTHTLDEYYLTTYGMGFLRTDNLEPNENVTKKVKNAS